MGEFMALNLKDYYTGISFLASFLKRYGKYSFVFIVVPILISILALFMLPNWTFIKDFTIGSILLLCLLLISTARIIIFFDYLKEQFEQGLYAVFIINLVKSKKFAQAMLSHMEYDSKQKIQNKKQALEGNINEINKQLKPLEVNRFFFTYIVINIITYCLFLTVALGFFQVISDKVASSQITGTFGIAAIVILMIPVFLFAVYLVSFDATVIKDFKDKIVVTEVVTKKETFIGDLIEENKMYVRVSKFEVYNWAELPGNIRMHTVEVDIPQNEIMFVINHTISPPPPYHSLPVDTVKYEKIA